MATPKTRANDDDVTAFLDAVPDERRRADARELRTRLERTTGAPARMWGTSIIGFGSAPYTNTTGTHDWFVVGYSPRKAALTIYGLLDGTDADAPMLDELGPHTTGKGCVYVKRLGDVDAAALDRLVERALARAGDGA